MEILISSQSLYQKKYILESKIKIKIVITEDRYLKSETKYKNNFGIRWSRRYAIWRPLNWPPDNIKTIFFKQMAAKKNK